MEERLRPWIRAEALEWPDLFWKPVSAFPCRQFEREWQAGLIRLLAEDLAGEGLEPCCFLEAASLQGALADAFRRHTEALAPVPGFSRRLWDPPPAPPPQETLDAIRNRQAPFDLGLFARGIAFWVQPEDLFSFTMQFGGTGGLSVLFARPAPQEDPLAGLPAALLENPFFASAAPGLDLRKELRHLLRMRDARMTELFQIFSRGWEEAIPFSGVSFMVPRLKSMDFFDNNGAILREFLRIAPVSLFESEPDGGLLLACAMPFSDRLARLMHRLRKQLDAGKGRQRQ